MTIGIYTISSPLHDQDTLRQSVRAFLESVDIEHSFFGDDFSTYGSHDLDIIYVCTGGTEGIFKQLMPQLLKLSDKPFCLMASANNNSLAASLEILSYLRQNGHKGEILHGRPESIKARIEILAHVNKGRNTLADTRLGIIGKPSDWLISSTYDAHAIKDKFGIEIKDFDLKEVEKLSKEAKICADKTLNLKEKTSCKAVADSISGALAIYEALKAIVSANRLSGITIRCFDLLGSLHNTGCLALAMLNAEGIVAGCEGDVPALLSMTIANALTGVSGFQANPAQIDAETGQILFAHCTIPFNMVARYELDTHFESGIGVGIHGYAPEGPVTVFKVSGDLQRHFVCEGTLVESQDKPNLCRTQQIIRLDNPEDARYFLTDPIGNHHIIIPGRWRDCLRELLS